MERLGLNFQMDSSCSDRVWRGFGRGGLLASAVTCLFAIGCERMVEEPSARPLSARTQVVEKVQRARLPRPPRTVDGKKADEARACLDEGDVQKAMFLARGLIDSKEPDIRAEMVEIFSWVGKKALPELTEMLKDPDPDVAADALRGLEVAIDEISHDYSKSSAITNAVATLENPVVIDAILMHISSIDSMYALPALQGLVIQGRGKTYGECAKRMFEHLAGEPWVSQDRTKQILRKEH